VHLTPADKGVAFGYWDTCNTCSDLVRLGGRWGAAAATAAATAVVDDDDDG